MRRQTVSGCRTRLFVSLSLLFVFVLILLSFFSLCSPLSAVTQQQGQHQWFTSGYLLKKNKNKKKRRGNNSSHGLPVRSVAGVRFHLDGAPPRDPAVNIYFLIITNKREDGDETCRRIRRSLQNLNKNEALRSIEERTCRSSRLPGGCVCISSFFSCFCHRLCVCFCVGVLFWEELFDGRLPMDE